MNGREWYREFHEQDHEHGEVVDEVKEVEPDDCPDCKWDEVCKGGCEAGIDCGYSFEKKEEEE